MITTPFLQMTMRRFNTFLACWLLLLALVPRGSGQTPIARLQYDIVGTQLAVTPSVVSVPKGIPGSVLVRIVDGSGASGTVASPLADGAVVEAVLRGPSFAARRLVGRPNEALSLPALNLVGDYQLDNIRLVDAVTGAVRLEGTPSSVPVRVFDEVLISKVTSRPLTMQEITEKGIVIDQANFRAVEFEVGFVLDGKTIPIKFPVVAPDFTGSKEIIPAAELEARAKQAQFINDLLVGQVVESPDFPEELQQPRLNLQIKGIGFQQTGDTEPENLRLGIPPIPALMVIPGNIGYLNQFFSVQIFTENGSPDGSGLSVHNVRARLRLPPGGDGILSTNYLQPGDDPLRLARVGTAQTNTISDELPLVGAGDNKPTRFFPGEGGTAEFLVEGLQEGLHVMDLDLTADLDGLAAGTVKIAGKAAGSVLVRNPKFSLTFTHPRTVRAGEPYNSYVTVLNTSEVEANLLTITLRGASLSGGVLESPETVQLGNVKPGQTVTAQFRVRAQRTGSVKFSNLTFGEDGIRGRFNLTMGIDERGVELSPDSIGYPDLVNFLPQYLLDAANRVLGQALGVSTAPLLPNGVKPVGRSVLSRRVLELAEAGQRIKLLDPTNRVAIDLLLDWQGGRFLDKGFDQIIRETDAGFEFRTALTRFIEDSDTRNATLRLVERAPDIAGRSERWLIASSSAPGLEAGAVGPLGSTTPTNSVVDRVAPYPGQRGGWAVGRDSTNLFRWFVRAPVANADVSAVLIATNGTGRQWRWTVSSSSVGGCFTFDPANPAAGLVRDDNCDGVPDESLPGTLTDILERPPEVLAVVQDISVRVSRPYPRCSPGPADNYGQVLAILFSKPMLQTNANIPAAYRLDNGNFADGVQIQPGGRVALLSMREGVSAIRPREMTVTGVTDQRGNTNLVATKGISSDFRDGVAVNTRVLRADGSPAASVPVTVTMYDPYKDPFDRCQPIYITRTSQKYTDTNGFVTFDFVHGGVQFTVAAVDTGGLTVEAVTNLIGIGLSGDKLFESEKNAALVARTNLLNSLGVSTVDEALNFIEGLDRAVWTDIVDFNGGRMGREIDVALRFRGRGVVSGTIVGADGQTPVPNAAVNLFPDENSRELVRGMLTGLDGRFEFRGVPLGLFSIQVQSPLRHFRTVSGNLARPRQTNDITIALTPPTVFETVRAALAGRVVEPDGVTAVAGARVLVGGEGPVALVETDAGGYFSVSNLPVANTSGRIAYGASVVTADGRRVGYSSGTYLTTNATAFLTVTLRGFGVVVGRVELSTGRPATNALVAGGEAIVRTDANGNFRLTGVPLGYRNIEVGLEARYAPGGLARLGNGAVEVLPGVDNFVVVRLPALGRIRGVVRNANGVPIVPNLGNVAIPVENGFLYAPVNPDGTFEFAGLSPRDYLISAPAPPVDEEGGDIEKILAGAVGGTSDQILAAMTTAVGVINRAIESRYGEAEPTSPGAFGFTTSTVRFDGDEVFVEIRYLPDGNVSGIVINDQEVPIGAAVRLTGLKLSEKGEPVIGILGTRNSDPASGMFRFSFLPQGPWAVQAASPFYPVVIVEDGETSRDALSVSNLVMRFPPHRSVNGRLAGNVVMPDGSPAGANVNVQISFGSDYIIRTDTNGFFDTQINIPARGYEVEARDPVTGLRGRITANVLAGITNFADVRLLGKGDLEVSVRRADGAPAIEADVVVRAGGYPNEQFSGRTDTNGMFRLGNLFEGSYQIQAFQAVGASRLEARGATSFVYGTTGRVALVFGPAGSIRGTFRTLAGGLPIAAGRVDIGNIASTGTDSAGRFEVNGVALGTYRILAREPVSGRLAVGSATIVSEGQVVEVSLVELAQSDINGTVFRVGENGPVAGIKVTLSQNSGLVSTRTVTTGPDGTFSFPAVLPGEAVVTAFNPDNKGSATRTLLVPDTSGTVNTELTLPDTRPQRGTVNVVVVDYDGVTPATNAAVRSGGPEAVTDSSGRAVLEVGYGTHVISARNRIAGSTMSVGAGVGTVTALNSNITVSIRLSGVGRLTGVVLENGGSTPRANASVRMRTSSAPGGSGSDSVTRSATALTDAQGRFEFGDLAMGSFDLTATADSLSASGGGVFSNANQVIDVALVLGPSGSVTGRIVRADGVTPVTGNPVVVSYSAPSGLDGVSSVISGDDGGFFISGVPVGPFQVESIQLANLGLLKTPGSIATNGQLVDLGVLLMDEDWPRVVDVVPAPGASGVFGTNAIDLTFSEPLATNSIPRKGIFLTGPTTNIPTILTWGPVTNGAAIHVRLRPVQPLRSLTTYVVTVFDGLRLDGFGTPIGEGPRDRVGRPLLQPFVSSFTTRDDDPPQLVSIFPTNGTVQVDPRAVPRLSFNEPVNLSTATVSLVGPGGPVGGTLDLGFNGLVLSFTPSNALPVNASFTLSVSGIRDLVGNLGTNQPYTTTFNTLDTLGPVVSQLRIADGRAPVGGAQVELEAVLAAPESGVGIRFSRDLSPIGSLSNTVFRLPVTLPTGGTAIYRAIATDRFGNDGPVAELTVTVSGNEPPTVVLLRGAPGNAPVQTGGSFGFTVGAYDDVGVTNITVVVSGVTNITRVFNSGATNGLTFILPSTAVAGGTIEVRARAYDNFGAVSPDAFFTWTVGDGTAPEVQLLAPLANAFVNPTNALPLRLSLLDNGSNLNVTVVSTGSREATNVFTVDVVPGVRSTNTLLLPLDGAPTNGGNFSLQIKVADLGLNTVEINRALKFQDVVAPRLVSTRITNGVPQLDLWGQYQDFHFSEGLLASTVTTNSVRLVDDAGTNLPVSISLNGTLLRVTYPQPLRPGAFFTNRLESTITDAGSNQLALANGDVATNGIDVVFSTARVLGLTPTNDAPVLGGDTIRVTVHYEKETGMRFFRFILNGGAPVDVDRFNNNTNAFADIRLPLDETNLVVRVLADSASDYRHPVELTPIRLRYTGNLVTNQPPAITLARVNPARGPLSAGQTFSVSIGATDDFGVTNLAFTATGIVQTNLVYTNGAARLLTFTVPTNALPTDSILLSATARDTQGALSSTNTTVPIIALQYPFAIGTLFYSRGPTNDPTVWAIDPDGGAEAQITAGAMPVVSPDGRYIAFKRGTSPDPVRNNLWVRDLATGTENQIVNINGDYTVAFDWQNDGTNLVYDVFSEISRISYGGVGFTRLLQVNVYDDGPSVNRFDGRLAFHNFNGNPVSGLYLADASGANRRKIPNTQHGDGSPAWSPDGEWIGFIVDGDVYRIRPDGFDRLRLTSLANTTNGFRPNLSWSADGRFLIAAGEIGSTNGLWQIAADTGAVTLRRSQDGVAYQHGGRSFVPLLTNLPPALVGVVPADGAIRQSLWSSNLVLAFSRAVDSNSVAAGLGAPTTGSVFQVNGSRVVVQPSLPLQPGTRYTNTVTAGVTDLRGQPAAPVNATFTTAAILEVLPTNNTTVAGGGYVNVSVKYEPGFGAQFFRFQLDSNAPVLLQVPGGGTQVSADLLVPLGSGDPVVRILASDDAAFSKPYAFPAIPLKFGGDSGTNAPPGVSLVRVSPVSPNVKPGGLLNFRATATSGFSVTNLAIVASGAVAGVSSTTNGGPYAALFQVPEDALPGSVVSVSAIARDALGVATTSAVATVTVTNLGAPSPAGVVYYSRGTGVDATVWAVNLDGSDDRQITTGLHPRVSPDNRYLLVGRDKANESQKNVYVVDLVTGDERLVFSHNDFIVFYDWTPDSAKIVFDYSCGIYRMNRDGSFVEQLFSGNCYDDGVTVSRLDGRIANHNDRGGNGLWISNPDATGRTFLTNSLPGDYWPQWSPDGLSLAFTRGSNVFRYSLTNGAVTQLTTMAPASLGAYPSMWTPDGSNLVFAATIAGTNGIFRVNAVTGGIPVLIPTTAGAPVSFVGSIAWPAQSTNAAPRLLAVSPANGATGQSLWGLDASFSFSKPINPASVTTARFAFENTNGVSVPFTVESTGAIVRVRSTAILQPSSGYRLRLLPGLADLSGAPAVGLSGGPIPASGVTNSFSTAALALSAPTNGQTVVAGQNLAVTVATPFGSGIRAARFRIGAGGVPVVAYANPNQSTISELVPVPAGGSTVQVFVDVAEDDSFARVITLSPVTLNLVSPGTDLAVTVPADLSLVQSQSSNLVFTARSTNAAIRFFGLAPDFVLPPFASVASLGTTNTATNGVSGFSLQIDTTFAAPGSHVFPYVATNAAGVFSNGFFTLVVATNTSLAVTRWKDPVNGNWADATKWSAGVPSATLPAAIDVSGSYTVTVASAASVGEVFVGAPSGRQALVVNGRFTVNGAAVLATNTTLTLSQNIAGEGHWTVGGQVNWTVGDMESGSGAFNLTSNALLRFTTTSDRSFGRVINNFGRVEWAGGRIFFYFGTPRGTFHNRPGAVFEIQDDLFLTDGTFLNEGLILKPGAARDPNTRFANFDSFLINRGEVRVEAGGFSLPRGGQSSGVFDLATNTVLFLGGSHTLETNALIRGAGDVNVFNGTTEARNALALGGVIINAGTLRLQQPGAVVLGRIRSSGTLGGIAALMVTNLFEWTGGNMESEGRLMIASNAVLRISGTSDRSFARVVENHGRTEWSGGRIFFYLGTPRGTFYNRPGGVFEIQDDLYLTDGLFVNEGLILKPGAPRDPNTRYANFDCFLINNGEVRVEAGGFSLPRGGQAMGTFRMSTNTVLFLGGSHRLEAGSLITGEGGVNPYTGTSEIFGNIAIGGLFNIGGTVRFQRAEGVTMGRVLLTGVLGGAAPVLVTNRLDWVSGDLDTGSLVIASNAVLAISGGSDRSFSRTIHNHGRTEWSGGRLFFYYGSPRGTFVNQPGAVFDIRGDLYLTDGTFVNRGLVIKSLGSGTSTLDSYLVNDGEIRAGSGLVYLSRGGNHGGVFNALSPSGLLVRGNHRFGSGSVVAGPGQFSISGETTLFAAGSMLDSGTINSTGGTLQFLPGSAVSTSGRDLVAGGSVVFNSGTTANFRDVALSGSISGSDAVTVTRAMTWTTGDLSGGGSFAIAPGATLDITGSNDRNLYRVLENYGVATYRGGRFFNNASGELRNMPSGVLDIVGGLYMSSGLVVNHGLIRKTSAATADFDNQVSNSGTLLVQEGVFEFGGGTNSGLTTISTGATLRATGTTTVTAPGRVDGAGAFDNRATLNFAGTMATTGPLNFGGTATFLPGAVGDFGGQAVAVPGALVLNTGSPKSIGTLNLTGTLGGSDNVTIANSITWSTGTMEGNGATVIPVGSTGLLVNGDRNLYRTLRIGGTVTNTAGRFFNNASGLIEVLASGRFEIAGALYSSQGAVNNLGLIRKTSTAVADFDHVVNNSGTILVDEGVFEFGGGTHSGTATVFSGATFRPTSTSTFTAAGRLDGAGALDNRSTLNFGGTFALTGALSFGGTTTFQPGAVADFAGQGVTVGGTLALNSGSAKSMGSLNLTGILTGSDNVTVSNSVTWTTGGMEGTGTTFVPTTAFLSIAGGDKNLDRTLSLSGTGAITSGRFFNAVTGRFNQQPGSRMDFLGDLYFSGGRWNNAGVIVKSGATNTTSFLMTMVNSGLIDLQSGHIDFDAGTNSGTVTVTNGARVELGTFTVEPSGLFTGGGEFLNSGQVRYAGVYDVTGLLRVVSTLNFTAGADARLNGRTGIVSGTLNLNTGTNQSLRQLTLSGTLGGTDELTVSNQFLWTSGNLASGTNALNIPPGAAFITTNNVDRDISRPLRVGGSATIRNGRFFNGTLGVLDILPGAVAELGADLYFSGGRVTNAGTFTKSGGTNTSDFYAPWINTGTLDIQAGTMFFRNPSTNFGTINIATPATLHSTGSPFLMGTGTVFTGSGTLRFSSGAQARFAAPVNFGTLQVFFEGSSSAAGDFTVRNNAGGLLSVDHNVTFAGDLTIGGEFRVVGAGTIATVTRTLTLEATGLLTNPGTVRAGAFANLGGTVVGNAPVVIGLPPAGILPARIDEIRVVSGNGLSTSASTTGPDRIVVRWHAPTSARVVIETSTDLMTWTEQSAAISVMPADRYETTLPLNGASMLFVRLRTVVPVSQ